MSTEMPMLPLILVPTQMFSRNSLVAPSSGANPGFCLSSPGLLSGPRCHVDGTLLLPALGAGAQPLLSPGTLLEHAGWLRFESRAEPQSKKYSKLLHHAIVRTTKLNTKRLLGYSLQTQSKPVGEPWHYNSKAAVLGSVHVHVYWCL